MKHDSTDTVALRNVGVECLYIAVGLLFLPRSLNILFRNLILMTKYTLTFEYRVCTCACTRQQPLALAYQSGTTKNIELSHHPVVPKKNIGLIH